MTPDWQGAPVVEWRLGLGSPASVSAPSVDKSGQRVTSPGVRDKGEKRLCPPLYCLLYIAELHSIPYCVSATPKQLWRLGHPIICLIGAAGGEKTLYLWLSLQRLENAILSLSIKILEHFRKCIMCIVV